MDENDGNQLYLDMLINKKRNKTNNVRIECPTLKRHLSNFYEHAMKNANITDDLHNFCKHVEKKLDKIMPSYEKNKINKLD